MANMLFNISQKVTLTKVEHSSEFYNLSKFQSPSSHGCHVEINNGEKLKSTNTGWLPMV
jgi:hypothetical protein